MVEFTEDHLTKIIETYTVVSNLDKKFDANLIASTKIIDDHEKRIRKVEGSIIKVLGVGAIVGFITGYIGRLFGGN